MAGAVRESFEEINSIDICHWFSPAEYQRTSGSGGAVLIQIKDGDHTCWRGASRRYSACGWNRTLATVYTEAQ
jgi:hypothetical protein